MANVGGIEEIFVVVGEVGKSLSRYLTGNVGGASGKSGADRERSTNFDSSSST